MRTIKVTYSHEIVLGRSLLVSGDIVGALENFKVAASSNIEPANYFIAHIHSGTYENYVNMAEFEKHMLIAASAGIDLAQYDIASFYYRSGNFEKALHYFQLAGEQGIAKSFYWKYMCQIKLKFDQRVTDESLINASENFSIRSMNLLARRYLSGEFGAKKVFVGFYIWVKCVVLTLYFSFIGRLDDYA